MPVFSFRADHAFSSASPPSSSLFLALIGMLLLAGCAVAEGGPEDLQRYRFTQIHMGMEVRVLLYAGSEEKAQEAADAAYERVAELDDVLSHYKSDSELSRLSKRAGDTPVAVSDDLFTVLERAIAYARASEGAFDVTVGPLVELWRASAESETLPDEDSLRAAHERVGWDHIRLDPETQTVQLLVPEMQLDLGGIAKGYVLDEAMAVLQEEDVEHALLEAGGDILVSRAPPDAEGWRIQLPDVPEPGTSHMLVVDNVAISTSGDTEQYAVIDGTRYSHVIDPRTGLGLTDQVMATVVAPTGTQADALSTTIGILGEEKGLELVDSCVEVEAYIRPSPWARLENDLPE